MNPIKIMQQFSSLKKDMEEMQKSLAEKRVESSVGGGKVTVVATASGQVVSIKIAPEMVGLNDVEALEELVLMAVQQAITKGKALANEEMGSLAKGLDLPPGLLG